MKKLIALIAIIGLTAFVQSIDAQVTPQGDSIETVVADSTLVQVTDSLAADSSLVAMDDMELGEDLDAQPAACTTG